MTKQITETAPDGLGLPGSENLRVSGAVSATTKPRAELLELAGQCGAVLTGKPDGSEAITVVFTIKAWRDFDAAIGEQK